MPKKKARTENTNRYPLKKHVRNVVMIIIGSCIDVFGYTIFISANGLLAGGVWGVASIGNHFVSLIPMPVFIVAINVPLLLWARKKLRLRFAIYTIFTILLQSALLMVAGDFLPVYTNNVLLACIFGGVLIGFGCGLIVRYHSSGGGTDIVGIMLKDKYDVSVGSISMAVNAVVVLCAGAIFGFEPAMYTMVQMYICSAVFNNVLAGMNRKRNMMIVTEHGHEISDRLLHEVGRGVTMMRGEGGFTKRGKDVLFCVLSRLELSTVREIIHDVDPDAFVCINETYEVLGKFLKKPQQERIAAERERRAQLAQATLPKAHDKDSYD